MISSLPGAADAVFGARAAFDPANSHAPRL